MKLSTILNEEMFSSFVDRSVADILANKLGLGIPDRLGSGMFASAYAVGDNKVLKVTCSTGDAHNFAALTNNKSPYLPRVYGVYKYVYSGREEWHNDREAYGIVVEELKVDLRFSNPIIDKIKFTLGLINNIKVSNLLANEQYLKKQSWTKSIKKGIYDLIESAREFNKRGMDIHDIHSKNIGVNYLDNWVILDLGSSECVYKPRQKQPKELGHIGKLKY